jgi:PAS domain
LLVDAIPTLVWRAGPEGNIEYVNRRVLDYLGAALLMPEGSEKFVHVLSHVLKDAAGNLEIVGAVMDVTENTRLYRALAEREAKIRRLVDANIIGVFVAGSSSQLRLPEQTKRRLFVI